MPVYISIDLYFPVQLMAGQGTVAGMPKASGYMKIATLEFLNVFVNSPGKKLQNQMDIIPKSYV